MTLIKSFRSKLVNNKKNGKNLHFLSFFIIGLISITSLGFSSTTYAATLKEITATVTYPAADANGHSAGELFSSSKDGGGVYINTKARIAVTGSGINGAGNTTCIEDTNNGNGLTVINGSFYYVLGQNQASCNLDNMKDGETYVIDIYVDTTLDGVVQTNGTDFKTTQNYLHRTYYTKPEADTTFVAKTDVLDGSGIVKTDVLPYKKGQIIGSGGTRGSCSGTGCDSNYYDVANLIPANVKKGVSFGPNYVGEMTSDSGTGITQVMAGGLCSGAGVTCRMMDYNNDGYQDIIRKDKNVSGLRQLSFFTFFVKGTKFILDQTYTLDEAAYSANAGYVMNPDIKFYTGDQFFDNAGVYYIVINKGISRTGYPGLTKYEIIKLGRTTPGSLLTISSLYSNTVLASLRTGMNSSRRFNSSYTPVLTKDTKIGVNILTSNRATSGNSNGPSTNVRQNSIHLIKSTGNTLVRTRSVSTTSPRNGFRDSINTNGTFLINNSIISDSITNVIRTDYNRHLLLLEDNIINAYNIDTGVSTPLINNANIALKLDSYRSGMYNTVVATLASRRANNFGKYFKSGSGNYFTKISRSNGRRLSNQNTIHTIYWFKYNTTTKLIEYVSSNGPYSVMDRNYNGAVLYIGMPNFESGAYSYNGSMGYALDFSNGTVGALPSARGYATRARIGGSVSTILTLENGKKLVGGRGANSSQDSYTRYRLYTAAGNNLYASNSLIFSADLGNSSTYSSKQVFGNIIVFKDGYTNPSANLRCSTYGSVQGQLFVNKIYDTTKNVIIGQGSRRQYSYCPGQVLSAYNLDTIGYNGTGAIFVYGTTLYNSITGDSIGGFTYNDGVGYADSTFNGYKLGNYYTLPDKTTGKTFLYEFIPSTNQLVLRSSNITAVQVLGNESLYFSDNGALTVVDKGSSFTGKISVTGVNNVTVFETGAIHYNGTSLFFFNGVQKDDGVIPQNANERWLGYRFYKKGLDASATFSTYLTEYRSIITTEGTNLIIGLLNGGNTIFQDTSIGLSLNDISQGTVTSFNDSRCWWRGGSYAFNQSGSTLISYNSGTVLFSNDAKNITITTSPYYNVSLSTNNYSYFKAYKNKAYVGASNFDFYTRDSDSTIQLFTKNQLVTSGYIPGLDSYISTYTPDRTKAITEYKKQNIALALNYDFTPTAVPLTQFAIRANNNANGWNKLTYETPSYINGIYNQNTLQTPIIKLGNITFVNGPTLINDLTTLNNKNIYDGGYDYMMMLDRRIPIKKSVFKANFFTGAYRTNYTPSGKSYDQCAGLTRAQLLAFARGCGNDPSRGAPYNYGNRIQPFNTVITLSDGSNYIYNKPESRRRAPRQTRNVTTYLLQNLSTGKLYNIPGSAIFTTNESGITSINITYPTIVNSVNISSSIDLDNISDNKVLAIANYFKNSNRNNNSNLYFSGGTLKIYVEKTGVGIYSKNYDNTFWNEELFFSGADINTYFQNNGSLVTPQTVLATGRCRGRCPAIPAARRGVFTKTDIGLGGLAQVILAHEKIPSQNFVTDGLFITLTTSGATNYYKANGTNLITLANTGTVINQVTWLNSNKYVIDQNGPGYTNQKNIYTYNGGNLVYNTTLLGSTSITSTYNGLSWTVKESMYKDLSNNYFIQIDNSLYPSGGQLIAIPGSYGIPNVSLALGTNKFIASNDPYVMDTNNPFFQYNALQNVLITDYDKFAPATFSKLSNDTIYLGKTLTNELYVLDVNGNSKIIAGNNATKLIEFTYGGGSYPKLKLGDGYVGLSVTKYTGGNTINDIVSYLGDPFFSYAGGYTIIGASNMTYYLWTYGATPYLRSFDKTTGTLLNTNVPNTKGVSKSIKSREDNSKVFLYAYDSVGKKSALYSLDGGALTVADIQQADSDPNPTDGSDVIVINGLQYVITPVGLLSMIPSMPGLTSIAP